MVGSAVIKAAYSLLRQPGAGGFYTPMMQRSTLLPTELIVEDLHRWMAEDGLNKGDITSQVVCRADEEATLRLVARESMVLCGLEPLSRGLRAGGYGLSLDAVLEDGACVVGGDVLATLSGNLARILGCERTILNMLGRLAGVATCTRGFVDAIAGTSAVITDTRKTMPGLRVWDKYAVVCGGGTSHRMGLHDAALFKDNHFAGLSLAAMQERLEDSIARARADRDLCFVEVEVDTLEQLDVVFSTSGVDIILLDNMSLEVMREAVQRRDSGAPQIKLEASGGITLDAVRGVAETGVDRIAVGALTRAAVMLDIGLDA
jgi:nicotinate-nucleotide pyrophosphorylase (carboxylating)